MTKGARYARRIVGKPVFGVQGFSPAAIIDRHGQCILRPCDRGGAVFNRVRTLPYHCGNDTPVRA
jgi:hypothetical protein